MKPLLRDGRAPGLDVGAVYAAHRRRLCALAAAITLDPWSAEEIVHDAFVGLQRHAGEVIDAEAYLQRAVVNTAVNRLRRRAVAARHPAPPPTPVGTPEVEDTWRVITRLPPRQRAVVVLRFWNDLTLEAIAEQLGWPLGSVKSTLHRALRTLKEELA